MFLPVTAGNIQKPNIFDRRAFIETEIIIKYFQMPLHPKGEVRIKKREEERWREREKCLSIYCPFICLRRLNAKNAPKKRGENIFVFQLNETINGRYLMVQLERG